MILIIGAGGVGQSIAIRFHELGEAVGLLIRPYQDFAFPFPTWRNLEEVPLSRISIIFLAVRDGQILPLAHILSRQMQQGTLLVHTAGSVPIAVLESVVGRQAGVLYPLQSFTPGRSVQWGAFPIFWEGHPQVEAYAKRLAGTDHQVHHATSEQRLRLHIGAVFTANFTNALLHIADTLARPIGSWQTYLPLLQEVGQKLHMLSPQRAQTGPAKRGDYETLRMHTDYLRQHYPELAPLYEGLTHYILQHLSQSSCQ
ncbi:MAG: DUF2520 domain-containing protein [Bacteroidia bacterium]|nr:DUF2520 domain-containing protein [Bacteroidia bacterium]MDW8236156.1 DUF2520 domain-containing protein [Bacteroidia bacterium]